MSPISPRDSNPPAFPVLEFHSLRISKLLSVRIESSRKNLKILNIYKLECISSKGTAFLSFDFL